MEISLANLMGGGDVAKTSPDILAHTLLETYARHAKGNPFRPGDLVTPRRNHGGIIDAGRPHVVLDVFPADTSELECNGIVRFFPDMRVLGEGGGHLRPYLAESLFYEPWLGEVAKI